MCLMEAPMRGIACVSQRKSWQMRHLYGLADVLISGVTPDL